jgi:hypothetical protein
MWPPVTVLQILALVSLSTPRSQLKDWQLIYLASSIITLRARMMEVERQAQEVGDSADSPAFTSHRMSDGIKRGTPPSAAADRAVG